MSDDLKLCIDCKWLVIGSYSEAGCSHPEAIKVDLVYGRRIMKGCEAMRVVKCGPEGKLWEPKNADQ